MGGVLDFTAEQELMAVSIGPEYHRGRQASECGARPRYEDGGLEDASMGLHSRMSPDPEVFLVVTKRVPINTNLSRTPRQLQARQLPVTRACIIVYHM